MHCSRWHGSSLLLRLSNFHWSPKHIIKYALFNQLAGFESHFLLRWGTECKVEEEEIQRAQQWSCTARICNEALMELMVHWTPEEASERTAAMICFSLTERTCKQSANWFDYNKMKINDETGFRAFLLSSFCLQPAQQHLHLRLLHVEGYLQPAKFYVWWHAAAPVATSLWAYWTGSHTSWESNDSGLKWTNVGCAGVTNRTVNDAFINRLGP